MPYLIRVELAQECCEVGDSLCPKCARFGAGGLSV